MTWFFCVQIRAIEDEIDLGQIEEVIQMAKNELNLIDYYHGTLLVSRFVRFHFFMILFIPSQNIMEQSW